jgi:hypothetical protein
VARNVSAMGVDNHVFTIVSFTMSANRRNLASDLMLPIAARRCSFCLATAAISPEFGPIADGYEAVDHRRELFEDELGSVYSCQKAAVHVRDRCRDLKPVYGRELGLICASPKRAICT